MGTRMHAIRATLSLRLTEVATGTVSAAVTASNASAHIVVMSGAERALKKSSLEAASKLARKLDTVSP